MGLTEPTTTRRRAFRAAAGITAATLLATMIAVGSPAGADEPEPRERHGPGVTTGDPSTPSDGETITTFTPTLPLDADAGEIVLRDATGATVTTSGAIDGAWTVSDGALAPGGTYEWNAVAVSGEPQIWGATPWYDKDVGVGDLRLGGTNLPVVDVQDTKGFRVAAGFGLPAQASGLSARFWPHHDLDELRDVTGDGSPLPPTMTPQPGSETIEAAADMRPHEEEGGACIGRIDWDAGSGPPNSTDPNNPNGTYTYIHCEHEYALDAIYTDLAAGAEPAAYNIEGRNVAPAFQMMITADQTGDGFELSTAGKDIISAQFPAQTGFGYRMLGYIEVPQTGTYTFGTTSPGGSRALLYDTSDDLGRTEISAPDAWSPADLADSCWARSDRHSFKNNQTGDRSTGWGWIEYHYEYEEGDPTWYQFPDEAWATLVERLNQACAPNNDLVRWGAPVELEAGRQYPIDLAGWVGVTGGTIGFHVDGPNSDPIAVPVEWLTPAPANTIDFELGHAPVATLDDELIAWTLNGYGDALIGIHPRDGLVTYQPDGLGGWTRDGGIPHIGNNFAPYDQPAPFPIADADITVHGEPDAVPNELNVGHITIDRGTGTMHGQLHASVILREGSRNTIDSVRIDRLDFTLDNDGTIISSDVSGRAMTWWPAGAPLTRQLNNAEGWLDTDNHVLHLEVIDVLERTRGITMAIPIDPQHILADPYHLPTTFPIASAEVEVHLVEPGGTLDGFSGGHIALHNGHATMEGTFTASATEPRDITDTVEVTHLDFTLDDDGTIATANVTGTVTVTASGHGVATFPLTGVSGSLDTNTHTLHLELDSDRSRTTLAIPIDPQHLTDSRDPYNRAAHFDVQHPHIRLSDQVPTWGDGATIVLEDRHAALSQRLFVSAPNGLLLGPGSHYLTIDHLEFELDDHNRVVNPTVEGTMRTVDILAGSDSTVALPNPTGHLDTQAHVLHLSFEAGSRMDTITVPIRVADRAVYPSTALAINDYGETLVVADNPHSSGDIAIVTKQDPTQPFASDNADIVWLNDLYTDAGMNIPPRQRGPLPQAVQITTDGNTVAVMQYDGDRPRLDVIDRATQDDPWSIIGSFATDAATVDLYATVPFAVGSDYDYLYLAVVNDGIVEIHSKDGSDVWQQTASHDPAGAVTSMSFDYYAENIAIGQPTTNKVTVLERTGTTQWSESTTLASTEIDRFGSTVTYKWGLLTVTADGHYDCRAGSGCDQTSGTARIYRDTDTKSAWGDYGTWYNLDLTTGTGAHAVVAMGGTATRPVIAAATVDTLGLSEAAPGYTPIQLY